MTAPNPVTPNPLPSASNPMNPVMPAASSIPTVPAPLPANLPVIPPKKKSNFFLIFFLVITFTLVIGILVGYYLSSTNSIPDINIPGVTQTPEASPTVTMEEPTTTPQNVDITNNPVSPTPLVLGKTYETTVLPWDYSFDYPSNWTANEISKQGSSLTMSFAQDHTGCATGEVICSLVFAINVAAEMHDPSVSTVLNTESIVIQNEGPVTITLYQYISNGNRFYMIPIRNGWIMANVASGKDDEAGTLFKQILASFISEESGDAM